jgi:hypothetical protein
MSDEDDVTDPMFGRRPASSSYSRGFVRGADSYVPGEERIIGAGGVVGLLACCLICHSTWACAPGGLVHPEINRMGERCHRAGSWLYPTSAEISGR